MTRPARLQGTDGIRATTALGKDVPGLTPVDAFLKRGILTEEFVELYCYCFCKWSEVNCEATANNNEIVVGWDPRDPEGHFTAAAVRGVRRSGATAVTIGIAATPLISMYQQYSNARGAIVISASHNFRTQNGIKLFLGRSGMKLLPDQDVSLTTTIYSTNYEDIPTINGPLRDESAQARDLFINFHTMKENTWGWDHPKIHGGLLVVDTANGALSGVAGDVFKLLLKNTTIDVLEVNTDTISGAVNVGGGVADLEGTEIITRGDPSFKKHAAAQALFAAKRGTACCFDADGDRYYGLVYNPDADEILVISGDEAAMHQAAYLKQYSQLKSPLFTYTVESDLQAGTAAIKLGFKPKLTAVGDKWLLSTAHSDANFTVACESSGHSITRGYLPKSLKTFYSGNGLKAAINTLRSVDGITSVANLAHPFASGLKKTLYVFYTNKPALPGILPELEAMLTARLSAKDLFVKRIVFNDEPDMLYVGVFYDKECLRQRSAIFVRNSGTEDKTGINLRGPLVDRDHLVTVGEEVRLYLYRKLKNHNHPLAVEEANILLGRTPFNSASERVLKEMTKGGLLILTNDGHAITKFGELCAASNSARL